jgi:microcompartment protein CcmL/EutN
MPKYRVQIEANSLEELRRLLFPEEGEKKRAQAGVSGVYIVRAKTAVTTACRHVLRCMMDVALAIIESTAEELAEVMQSTPYPEEEEEARRALKVVEELAEKLQRDQADAVNFCCKWMGRIRCQVQCR